MVNVHFLDWLIVYIVLKTDAWITRKRRDDVTSLPLYIYYRQIQLSREEGWNPIKQFNPTTFLCLSQTRIWISNVICHGLFCVQWFEVKVDCLFCWYLWNCWWSLFKLSFHNLYKFVCNCSTGEQLGALVSHYGTIIFSLCSFVTDNMKTILRYLYNCVNSVYLFIYRYLFYPNTKLLF